MRHLSTQGQGFSPVLNSNALADFCRCHSLQQEYTKRARVSQPWQRCSSLRVTAQRFVSFEIRFVFGIVDLRHKHTPVSCNPFATGHQVWLLCVSQSTG